MLKDFIVDNIDNLKGQDIITRDVRSKSSITDCMMIICTGTSSRHVMFIADHVVQQQASRATNWIIVDPGDVVVHVMQEESRCLYELEKLWS